MTEVNKKMQKESELESEAMAELSNTGVNARVLSQIEGTNDLIKYIADRFNSMREKLAECCQLMKYQDSEAKKYIIMSKAIAQGDYGLLLDEETDLDVTYQVEEAGEFARVMENIANTKKFETRMQACCHVNKRILEAIEAWESKIVKMKQRTSLDGSSSNELEVVRKKIMQFEEAVKILKKRGSMVTAAFYDTRDKVQAKIKKLSEEFTPINYNEKPQMA